MKTRKLATLRARIDRLDERLFRLLADRRKVACAIGRLKAEAGLPIFQRTRLNQLLAARAKIGRKLAFDPTFVRRLFRLIHDQSVRHQREIYARAKRGKR